MTLGSQKLVVIGASWLMVQPEMDIWVVAALAFLKGQEASLIIANTCLKSSRR